MGWEHTMTKQGLAILAGLNGETVTITSAFAGSGTVPEVDLMELTELVKVEQNLSILEDGKLDNKRYLRLQITNENLSNDYVLNQIGVFISVNNSEPILYFIAQNTNGDNIPAKNTAPGFIAEYLITLIFTNDSDVVIVPEATGFITPDALDARLINKADSIHTHEATDINNLTELINLEIDKADTSHTHETTDINNLSESIDVAIETHNTNSSVHISSFASKADKSHTHETTDINNLSGSIDAVIGTHNTNSSAHSSIFASKADKNLSNVSNSDFLNKANSAGVGSSYVHPSTHPASMITGLASVATSGSYSSLSGLPTIPSYTSQLTNNSGFVTQSTGTWTPVATFLNTMGNSPTNVNGTSNNYGRYYKIGNVVFLQFKFSMKPSENITSFHGGIKITGTPFNTNSSTYGNNIGSIYVSSLDTIYVSTATNPTPYHVVFDICSVISDSSVVLTNSNDYVSIINWNSSRSIDFYCNVTYFTN